MKLSCTAGKKNPKILQRKGYVVAYSHVFEPIEEITPREGRIVFLASFSATMAWREGGREGEREGGEYNS